MLASQLTFRNELPVYGPLNNSILSGVRPSPAKDINTFHEAEFVMDRREFVQRNPPASLNSTRQKWLNGTAVPFTTTDPTNVGKKWIPNANRDASAIVAKERVTHVGQSSLNVSSGPLSYGQHNRATIQQDVARQRARLRGSGKCAPAKCRSSTSTSSQTPVFLAGPQMASTSYLCGPPALEKLRGNKSLVCQTEAAKNTILQTNPKSCEPIINKSTGIRTYTTRFYPLGRFQTWINKPVPAGVMSVPLPSH